jgi:hypothetical protein
MERNRKAIVKETRHQALVAVDKTVACHVTAKGM